MEIKRSRLQVQAGPLLKLFAVYLTLKVVKILPVDMS